MKVILLVAACLAITSCSSTKLQYNKMSDEEISIYNSTVQLWDRVICVTDVRAGSHIPKRRCETLREMRDGSARGADSINVASYGSNAIFR